MNTAQKVLYGISAALGIAAGVFPQYSAFLVPLATFFAGFGTRNVVASWSVVAPATPTQQELPFVK